MAILETVVVVRTCVDQIKWLLLLVYHVGIKGVSL